MKKKILLFLSATGLVGLLIWLFIASSKPLPGEKLLQDGRNHLAEESKLDFKFNPPTSGDHYASWIKKGFYGEPRIDGNLVHSLEHGYVIIWYDCGIKKQGLIKTAFAHEETATPSSLDSQNQVSMTEGSEGSPSAHFEDMPKSFSDGSCDSLKSQLKDIYNKLGPHKVIVMPRVGMDHPIILTAWGRMEKLDSVDHKKIKEFIDAFRDQGPEQTTEP